MSPRTQIIHRFFGYLLSRQYLVTYFAVTFIINRSCEPIATGHSAIFLMHSLLSRSLFVGKLHSILQIIIGPSRHSEHSIFLAFSVVAVLQPSASRKRDRK